MPQALSGEAIDRICFYPRAAVRGACTMPKSPEINGASRARRMRPALAPLKAAPSPSKVSKVSSDVSLPAAAAVALMRMGMCDFAEIAEAVGLSVADVKRIDRADDDAIRRLGADGIPIGEYFKLHRAIRCPRCNGSIRVVPCVACTCRSFPAPP